MTAIKGQQRNPERVNIYLDGEFAFAMTREEAVLQGLRDRLSDDLDSPGAIALVDAWAAETLAGGDDLEDEAPRMVCDAVDALLGVALDSCAQGGALDSYAGETALGGRG